MGDKKVIISKSGEKFAVDGKFFQELGVVPPDGAFEHGGVKYYPLKYTLRNACLAATHGYPIESPVHHKYTWVGKFTPLNHQKETSAFFTYNKRGYCHNGLGSGKTMSALWAADYMLKEGIISRILILGPLSTLPDAWERTLFNHMPHIRYHLVHGAGKKALIDYPHEFKNVQVFIANHEFVRSSDRGVFVCKDLLPLDLVIVDEGASFRALGTEKSKGLKQLLKDVPYVWWMTATPTPNSPVDAWMQADIMGTRQGMSYANFRDKTMIRVSEHTWVPRPNAAVHVKQILSPSICFRTEDCIDLPGITYQNRAATMTTDQKKVYTELSKNAYVELMNGGVVSALNEGIKANKLLQVACGILYTDDSETAEVAAVDKLHILSEILDEADTPVIVFAPYKSVVKHLAAKLHKHNPEVILGDVNIRERKRIFDAVQDGSCRLLIAHPRTMSHGVTLTASACIVWYAPVYSNETYEQANGRIYRQGQNKHCNVIHITSCEVEREMYHRLEHRQKMQGAVLDALRSVVKIIPK